MASAQCKRRAGLPLTCENLASSAHSSEVMASVCPRCTTRRVCTLMSNTARSCPAAAVISSPRGDRHTAEGQPGHAPGPQERLQPTHCNWKAR